MKIHLTTIGIQINFDTSLKYFKSKSERTKFYKELYGYSDHSKYSEYEYDRPGILSGMKYLKPDKSVLIVGVKDAQKLREFFRKWKVKYKDHVIILHEEEAKRLGVSRPDYWERWYEYFKGDEDCILSVDFG